jgi:hypothetical protein
MIRSRFASQRLAPTVSRLLCPTCLLTWFTWSGSLFRSEMTGFGALIILPRSLSRTCLPDWRKIKISPNYIQNA